MGLYNYFPFHLPKLGYNTNHHKKKSPKSHILSNFISLFGKVQNQPYEPNTFHFIQTYALRTMTIFISNPKIIHAWQYLYQNRRWSMPSNIYIKAQDNYLGTSKAQDDYLTISKPKINCSAISKAQDDYYLANKLFKAQDYYHLTHNYFEAQYHLANIIISFQKPKTNFVQQTILFQLIMLGKTLLF